MRSSSVNKYSVIGMVLASGTLMAQAPAATPNKICVINLQSAMLSTKEGQAAAEDFRTKFAEPEEKKLQAKQAEITELNDKLQRGANTMSQTAQDDMKRTIDRKSPIPASPCGSTTSWWGSAPSSRRSPSPA